MSILRIIVGVGMLEEMDGEGFRCEGSFAEWRSAKFVEKERYRFRQPSDIYAPGFNRNLRRQMIKELESRNLFYRVGEQSTEPISFRQDIEQYVEAFHARNGFSRERMTEGAAHAFDSETRELVSKYCPEGVVELQIVGTVIWGSPTIK